MTLYEQFLLNKKCLESSIHFIWFEIHFIWKLSSRTLQKALIDSTNDMSFVPMYRTPLWIIGSKADNGDFFPKSVNSVSLFRTTPLLWAFNPQIFIGFDTTNIWKQGVNAYNLIPISLGYDRNCRTVHLPPELSHLRAKFSNGCGSVPNWLGNLIFDANEVSQNLPYHGI